MTKVRDENLLKLFGNNVRRLRETKDLSQEQLAEDASISQTQVARIEGGTLNTTISTLYALKKALDCDINEFFMV